MKRFSFIIILLAISVLSAKAQNMNCLGLKNPTNFTFTGGDAQSIWYGAVGTKPNAASTCSSLGASLSTTVTAANLESYTPSSTSCTSVSSFDIHGNNDYQRRFVIKGTGTDAATGNHLSYLPPDQSFTSSVRLGNFCGGHEAEQLSYEFTVNTDNMLITLWFALSLQNGQHSASENPEFVITVEKKVGNNWVLAGGDTLCYVRPTPAGNGSDVTPFYVGSTGLHTGATYGCNVYLPWNKVIINLSRLQYQRVRIKLTAGDCSQSAHYACCYIAGECQGMRLFANGCAAGNTDQVAEIRAPKGAVQYTWYRSIDGLLSGPARNDLSNYVMIPDANDSILAVTIDHFVNFNNIHDTNTQSTFLCQMKTIMNLNTNVPIMSTIVTDVGNTKPRMGVDSILVCDGSIILRNTSYTPYSTKDSDLVDTSITKWYFYNSTVENPLFLLDSAVGGTVTYQYPNAGQYSVTMRTSAFDTSCWNSHNYRIRIMKAPEPAIRLERDNLCKGDTIVLYNNTTPVASYHEWTFHLPTGDTTVVTPNGSIRWSFDTTTTVTLRTHTSQYTMRDTNNDGVVDRVYCYAETDTVIHVGEYPKLTVLGDTIVCNGDLSDVYVVPDINGCSFDWYSVLGGTTPVQENNSHLITSITQDRRFYVKVTSPFGCISWDSVDLYLVKPTLNTSTDRICTGDTVTLWAGKAATYEWTATPYDPSFVGQEGNDTIRVWPTETTTYSVVGHGTNGCGATALTQKVTVYPYPIMHVGLTPEYVDSENPSVQFSDLSEYGVTSLWNFGNGNTSSVRTVVFTFSDLSKDSILISLTTGNALGCTSDTSFYIPVGIFAVWFPNAFTPKLETNKFFKPFTANDLEDYELYIYDRNGTLVFKTTDVEEGWDGTFNGKDCMQGVYVYISKYRRPGVDRVMSQKGTVTLLR